MAHSLRAIFARLAAVILVCLIGLAGWAAVERYNSHIAAATSAVLAIPRVSEELLDGEDGPAGPAYSQLMAASNTDNTRVYVRTEDANTRDLYVTSSLLGGDSIIGAELTYGIYYYNAGNASVRNVFLTDTLPAGVSYVSSSGPFTPTVFGSNLLVWNIGTVSAQYSPGYQGYLKVTVHVSEAVAPGKQLCNRVDIATSDVETGTLQNSTTDCRSAKAPIRDLYLSKVVFAGTPVPGNVLSYRTYYYNTGNTPAANVVISDTLPPGMTYDPAYGDLDSSGWTRVVSGSQVTWTRPSLDPSASGSVHVSGLISADISGGTILSNHAQIATSDVEHNYANNLAAHAVVILLPGRDLEVSQSWETGHARPGRQLVYRISYRNAGALPASNSIITDILPPGMSYSGSSYASYYWNMSRAGNVITWTRSTVGGGEAGYIDLRVDVSSAVPEETVLTNTVWIGSSDGDDDPSDNRATMPLAITADRDLFISKSLVGGQVVPGHDTTYRIYYRNYGTSDASHVVVTDTLPEGMSFISASVDSLLAVEGDKVVWNLGSVPGRETSGNEGNLYVSVRVSDKLPLGSLICNRAEIATPDRESGLSANASIYCARVEAPSRDLVVINWLDGNPTPGNPTQYKIYFQNRGSSPARDVIITDVLPVSSTLAFWAGSTEYPSETDLTQLIKPTVDDGKVSWYLGTVVASGSGYIYPSIQLDGNVPVAMIATNRVQVRTSDAESNYSNNSTSYARPIVEPTVDMSITKRLSFGAASPGNVLRFSLEFENRGDAPAHDVIITDTLPASAIYESYTGGYYDTGFVPIDVTPTVGSGLVQWYLGTVVASGAGYIYPSIRLADNARVGSVITNTAQIGSSDVDSNYGNNLAVSTLTVITPTVDISVTKSLASGQVAPGNLLGYEVYFQNRGYGPSRDVVVTDTLSNWTSYVDWSGYAYNPGRIDLRQVVMPTISGNQVRWYLGTVVGSGYGYIYPVISAGSSLPTGSSITNSVAVGTRDAESNYANNTAFDRRTVDSPTTADLSIAKQLSRGRPAPGSVLTYTIRFENKGSLAADNVVITDILPSTAAYVSYSGHYYGPDYRPITVEPTRAESKTAWPIGALVGGGLGYLTITLRLDEGALVGSIFTNTAEIGAGTVESTYANNTAASADGVVLATRDVQVNNWLASRFPVAGGSLIYGIGYRNNGNVSAQGIVITATLPVSTSYLSSSGPVAPQIVGNQVVWALGSVPGRDSPGYYGTLYLTVRLAEEVQPGTLLINSVEVGTGDAETNYFNNATQTTVTAMPPFKSVFLPLVLRGYASGW